MVRKVEVFKVQLSLASSQPVRQVLAYNESGSLMWQGDAPSELRGQPLKAFWYGWVSKDKRIILDRKVPKKEWPEW